MEKIKKIEIKSSLQKTVFVDKNNQKRTLVLDQKKVKG